jgi:hypothetical protein
MVKKGILKKGIVKKEREVKEREGANENRAQEWFCSLQTFEIVFQRSLAYSLNFHYSRKSLTQKGNAETGNA